MAAWVWVNAEDKGSQVTVNVTSLAEGEEMQGHCNGAGCVVHQGPACLSDCADLSISQGSFLTEATIVSCYN